MKAKKRGTGGAVADYLAIGTLKQRNASPGPSNGASLGRRSPKAWKPSEGRCPWLLPLLAWAP